MEYIIRTADRAFTEANYDSLAEALLDWAREISAGTHYLLVVLRQC